MNRERSELPPWESMMKRMVWRPPGEIQKKKALDFGSGIGVTAGSPLQSIGFFTFSKFFDKLRSAAG